MSRYIDFDEALKVIEETLLEDWHYGYQDIVFELKRMPMLESLSCKSCFHRQADENASTGFKCDLYKRECCEKGYCLMLVESLPTNKDRRERQKVLEQRIRREIESLRQSQVPVSSDTLKCATLL